MRPVLIAHRGDSAHAPENTERAFRQAIDKGADWIETDLQLTADGQVVAFHDDDLQRLTGALGRLSDYNLNDLKTLRVLTSRWRPGEDTAVPTFERVLELGRGISFYLELKSNGAGRADARGRRLLQACLEAVEVGSRHALASFDVDLVRGALEAGRSAILIASGAPALDCFTPAELAAMVAVSVRHDRIDARLAARLADCGARLWAWTVDEPADVSRMIDLGVTGICTNDVARVSASLSGPAS